MKTKLLPVELRVAFDPKGKVTAAKLVVSELLIDDAGNERVIDNRVEDLASADAATKMLSEGDLGGYFERRAGQVSETKDKLKRAAQDAEDAAAEHAKRAEKIKAELKRIEGADESA